MKEYIITGYVLLSEGKYLDRGSYTWVDEISEATIFNGTNISQIHLISSFEKERIADAELIPVKIITTYQLGDF